MSATIRLQAKFGNEKFWVVVEVNNKALSPPLFFPLLSSPLLPSSSLLDPNVHLMLGVWMTARVTRGGVVASLFWGSWVFVFGEES